MLINCMCVEDAEKRDSTAEAQVSNIMLMFVYYGISYVCVIYYPRE